MKPSRIITFSVAFVFSRCACSSHFPTPDFIETEYEAPTNTIPTKSYVTELDYILNVDWQHDFLKFNFPLSYELPSSLPEQEKLTYPNNYDFDIHGPPIVSDHQNEHPPSYLYSRQLFFNDIPHIRLLLNNQHLRKFNNLAPLHIRSLRKGHPFERSSRK